MARPCQDPDLEGKGVKALDYTVNALKKMAVSLLSRVLVIVIIIHVANKLIYRLFKLTVCITILCEA